jgi:hypothetical protein
LFHLCRIITTPLNAIFAHDPKKGSRGSREPLELAIENDCFFLIAGTTSLRQDCCVKKAFALIIALLSAWVLFTPFDLPPVPFFFLDEAIALILFTKSMALLGVDVTRFLPFFRGSGKKPKGASAAKQPQVAPKEPVIDV